MFAPMSGFLREALHFRRPVSPLFSTIVLPAIEHGYRNAPGSPGAVEHRLVDGWVYARLAPAPPRDEGAARMLGELADVWQRERVPEVRRILDQIRALAGAGASARRIAGELDALQAALDRLFTIHYEASFGALSGSATLHSALARRGDPSPELTAATLTAPCPSLQRDVDAWLAEHAGASAEVLAATAFWPEVRDRPAWLDVAAPTWGEDPRRAALAAAAADARAFREATARAEARRAEAEAVTLARFPTEMQDAVRGGLAMMRAAKSAQQTLNYLVGEVAVGVARGVLLRAGWRLAEARDLAHADDVFLLDRAELVAMLRGEPVRVDAGERRTERARAERTPPPESLGEVAPEQRRAALGAAPRRAALQGLGASAGIVEGVARVCHDEDEVARLSHGEILVVTALLPAWTSAMQRAGGIVAELGGMLCHAAVVARELGVPAAVGVGEATARIRTGVRLRVDGATGEVAVLNEKE